MRQLTMSLISGLVGALIAVAFQSYLGYTFDELATKRDVLRRFAGNRYVLTENPRTTIQPNGEPFVALNEAFIVFAKDPRVIEALRVMHDQLGQQGRLVGLSRSLLIFASGGCAVILCDSLGGRLLLGFEITEG